LAHLVGADPEQLDALGHRMIVSADRLEAIRGEIGALLNHGRWEGTDAERFRGRWYGQLAVMLNSASVATRDAAVTLRANADQQRAASGAEGRFAAAPGGSGSSAVAAAVTPDGQWRTLYAEADADWVAGFDGSLVGMGLSASAVAGLAAYRWQDSFTVGRQRIDITGEAFVGGRADADVFAGFRSDNGKVGVGVQAGGEAFAGAELRGSAATSTLGDVVGAQVNGSLRAGVGVTGEATVMFQDGKLVLGAKLGAAVGLGASAGVGVTLDLEKFGEHAGNALDGAVDLTEDAMDEVQEKWTGFLSALPG
jgi:hypothetical protein